MMDRKQKQLPPIQPWREADSSPRGYERENTSPRGYEKYSSRGKDRENISPRDNISPRGKNDMISPRLDNKENSRMVSRREREKISPRLEVEDRAVSPRPEPRNETRSPRLERRSPRKEKETGVLLNNRKRESDSRVSTRANGELNPVDIQDFRNLCIGSPIPNPGYSETEVPYGDNHRKNSSDKGGSFPSIMVQKCEEGDAGFSAGSPRGEASTGGSDSWRSRAGGRSNRSHSPTPLSHQGKKVPKSPHHRPRTIDATLPTAATGQMGRSATGNLLRSPSTPPVEQKVGGKKFVVYDKSESPSPTEGRIPQLGATRSHSNANDETRLNLRGIDDDRSLPTSPRSEGALSPNPSPWSSPRAASPNRLSSSDGATSKKHKSHRNQNKPHHLEPINQPRGRQRKNSED